MADVHNVVVILLVCCLGGLTDGGGLFAGSAPDECKYSLPDTRENQTLKTTLLSACQFGALEWWYTWNNVTVTISRDQPQVPFQMCILSEPFSDVAIYHTLPGSTSLTRLEPPIYNKTLKLAASKHCAKSQLQNGREEISFSLIPPTIYYGFGFTWVILTGDDILEDLDVDFDNPHLLPQVISRALKSPPICTNVLPEKGVTEKEVILRPGCIDGNLFWFYAWNPIRINFTMTTNDTFQLCLTAEEWPDPEVTIYDNFANTQTIITRPLSTQSQFEIENCVMSKSLETKEVVSLQLDPVSRYYTYSLSWKLIFDNFVQPRDEQPTIPQDPYCDPNKIDCSFGKSAKTTPLIFLIFSFVTLTYICI